MRTFQEQITDIRKNRRQVYKTRTLDLTTARSEEEFTVAGNYIIILDATDLNANIQLRFNEMEADQITLKKRQGLKVPFYRMFITNAAQAGKTVTIAYGINDTPLEIVDQSAVIDINSIAQAVTVYNGSIPAIYNVSCAVAGTEYSQAFGGYRQKFTVKARGGPLKVCFTATESGTKYIYLADGESWSEDNIKSSLTLYFQSPTAGTIAEVLTWG